MAKRPEKMAKRPLSDLTPFAEAIEKVLKFVTINLSNQINSLWVRPTLTKRYIAIRKRQTVSTEACLELVSLLFFHSFSTRTLSGWFELINKSLSNRLATLQKNEDVCKLHKK